MIDNKNNSPAKYAFIGLIVAGLACVSSGLTGIAKGMVSQQIFTLEETLTKNIDLAFNISLALIVIGLAAYAIMVPDQIRRFLTGRQARYGSNSLILIVAFLGILITANVLVFRNPDFLKSPWDMTEDKSNTLAPETLQALETLPGDVTATAYYSVNLDNTSAEELLTKFKNNSNGKFTYKFIDPDQDPVSAREAGITGDGKILLQMGETKEIVSFASESELTQALIRLINPGERTVYFLQGHGEPSLEAGGGQLSFSIAKSTLESKNYTVSPLNLIATNKIPEDALAIIIAGPLKPISSGEMVLLKDYMEAGGSLVVMEDPTIVTEFGDTFDPLAKYLDSDWGIKLNEDMVIDLVNTQNPLQAVSSQIVDHPITQNLTENYIVILPQARSISVSQEPIENVSTTPIILTTDQSWGETEMSAETQPEFSPEKDTPGPLNLAAVAENSATGGRVVVFGNSIFATDEIFDAYGNGNMFINSVDWAAEQEDLINITPREQTQRMFTPPTNGVFIIMIIISIFVLPGLIVFSGVSSWIARRKKG
ncbi:MAG TPA: Gldg family protein [Anaerolineales bacterium]|nr:Gldg family protein [Anaerolineales bacterium]